MNAIRTKAAISADHTLHVALPASTPPGEVEVIVLFPNAGGRLPRKAGSARGRIRMARDFDHVPRDFEGLAR